jgi:hypothetical protein
MKLRFGFALLSVLLCASAHAQNNQASQAVEVVTGPVCETQEDVQRYIARYDGDAQATVEALNAEVDNPHACGIATVAYLRGPQIGNGWGHDTAFEIVRILVVGVDTKEGIRTVRPAAFFTVFGVREFAV